MWSSKSHKIYQGFVNMNGGLMKVGLKFGAFTTERIENLNTIVKMQKKGLKKIINNPIRKHVGAKTFHTAMINFSKYITEFRELEKERLASFRDIIYGFSNQVPLLMVEMSEITNNYIKVLDSEDMTDEIIQQYQEKENDLATLDLEQLESELKLKPLKLKNRISLMDSPQKRRERGAVSENGEVLDHETDAPPDHDGAMDYVAGDKKYAFQFDLGKSLRKKFLLTDTDIFFDSWNCAIDFKNRVPIQGKLYVFNTKFGFWSPFNKNNLFFGSTTLIVPFAEVTCIEKRHNSLYCHNTIHIQTIKGKVIFTSFLQRDSAFTKLEYLRKFNSYENQNSAGMQRGLANPDGDDADDPAEGGLSDYQNENFLKRTERIEYLINSRDHMEPTDDIHTEELEGVTALETLAIWLGLDGVCTGEGMPAYLGSLVESWKSECMN
jgi:hypothetical protein